VVHCQKTPDEGGNASGRTSEEVQQKLLPGLGYFDASRASFGSPVPPIGACRGAKPLCVSSIPQEWGIKGVDQKPVQGVV
jgi:hypothetical protein